VLGTLEDLGGHPTADEVLTAIIAAGGRVSRATVFNALDDLTAAGLVMHADAGPGAVRYEAATAAHDHFVCARCGKVIDVPSDNVARPAHPPPGFDGRVDGVQIIYRGVCSACRDE
jgi:Fe2+ or Zn2+ uptake regulation protein